MCGYNGAEQRKANEEARRGLGVNVRDAACRSDLVRLAKPGLILRAHGPQSVVERLALAFLRP